MDDAQTAGRKFSELIRIIDRLRGEQGCPWDRKQTARTLVNFFLEEVYEAVDAVVTESTMDLKEELGDVLMEIVFLARIYKEKGQMTMTEVVEGINRKMIHRHPHVFEEQKKLSTAGEVRDEWNRRKKKDKSRRSLLDGIPRHTPALLEAFQVGSRAAAYGFDWENAEKVLEKAKEEWHEMEAAVKARDRSKTAEELGDLFFALAQTSRHLKINPEVALKRANLKFMRRFQYIEKKLHEKNKDLEEAGLEEMEALWLESKSCLD
ncbi:MAG: nucleoside triphosphate pyrophosphohydrolase [Candidatus Aminicenantes bacterium]